jgi:hypothetical protein
VACTLQIIQTLIRTPLDQFARDPKLIASYAYRWDSNTNALTLFSANTPGILDKAYAINDKGDVAGSSGTVSITPQGVVWKSTGKSLYGPGKVTDINNLGDMVFNGKLILNGGSIAAFQGKLIQVQAINPVGLATTPRLAAGTQSLSGVLGESGTGRLYTTLPAATKLKPWYAYATINKDVFVKHLTDNGNFVISGTPTTTSGLLAMNCTAIADCQVYSPTVGFGGRTTPFITANSVNSLRQVVGTDGGLAWTAVGAGPRTFLNASLQPAVLASGWFLNDATSINDAGKIVGMGLKGAKMVAYLATPI